MSDEFKTSPSAMTLFTVVVLEETEAMHCRGPACLNAQSVLILREIVLFSGGVQLVNDLAERSPPAELRFQHLAVAWLRAELAKQSPCAFLLLLRWKEREKEPGWHLFTPHIAHIRRHTQNQFQPVSSLFHTRPARFQEECSEVQAGKYV